MTAPAPDPAPGPGPTPGPASVSGSGTHPVGPHLVIASEETAAALASVLTGLPALPGALLVLAAAPDAALVLRRALPELVALAGERGADRLVLAASGLAARGPSGGRPVAAVATAAGFTVVAPDGVVSVEPDGTLRLAEPGGWWLAAPGEEPYELGPGWPPEDPRGAEDPEGPGEEGAGPEEEREPEAEEPEPLPPPAPPVPVVAESQGGAHGFGAAPRVSPGGEPTEEREEPDGTSGAMSSGTPEGEPGAAPRGTPEAKSGVTPVGMPGEGPAESPRADSRTVPGGVWLGGLPEAVEPLIGVGPETFLLGVGSPACPALPAAELLARVPRDAADARHLLLSAPWADPADLVAMATALADRFGRTVRAAVGLPVRTADDHATTYLDGRGAPTWQPLLLELAASPAHRRVVPSAWLGLSGQEAAAPALYGCADAAGWAVELVPAGVWLRPADRVADSRPRTVRPDPSGPVLLVGDGGRAVGAEIRGALPGVLAGLPDVGAREPYGLLFHGDAADEEGPRSWAGELDLRWLGSTGSRPVPEPGPVPGPRGEPVSTPPGNGLSGASGAAPGEGSPAPRGEAAGAVPPSVPPPTGSGPTGAAPSLEPGRPETGSLPTGPGRVPAVPPVSPPVSPPVAPEPGQPVGEAPVAPPVAPAPPVSGSPKASVSPPVAGGRSGPDDRAALRELLGEKYHILASKAELLASRLPSLRSLAQEGLKADMVAIALYQADAPGPGSRAGLAEAARTDEPGPFTPLLRCLESGLRRLPGHYGAVMLAAPLERVPLDRYVPGTVLVEPAAVASVPACDAELEGAVEFGIWSSTGRRTSVFLGTDDEPEVVFPPGTSFSVLALDLPEDDTAPVRVLLREISAVESDGADGRVRRRDEQARTRLTEWFERRDMLESHDRRPLPDAARFHVAPGAAPH
ncbi:hypothetical protein [Streptomyces sp. NPDC094049]|uniref:hypothetical protein n=1 Tax=Streptomyces sp. NPDC094049 TaxID=3154987 RepID=UPI003316BD59